MNNIIEIEKLTKDYLIGFWRKRPQRSLNSLSLEVQEGEIFGFLGPNGAGKTTTLKLLMHLIYPTSGTARIMGKSIDDTAMRQQIGYLPEHPYFYDYLTARELLNYYGRLFDMGESDRKARIAELLKLVDMEEFADRQLRKFSKGMVQRIGIAQALINRPKVVFLDEPMSGLDPLGRRQVRDIIASLREQGVTVFFSSHILSDVEVLCDRVAILNRGEKIDCGRLDDLTKSHTHGVEVVASNISDATAKELSDIAKRVTEAANGVTIELESERKVDEVLAIIRKGNGRLISVNPAKISLEDFFMQEIGERQKQRATEQSQFK